jgi:ankyrin repeat protein
MPRKRTGKGTKRAGAKKTEAEPTMDLTVPAMALTKQLAEAMRWRSMEWARIPALTRKLTMPYLTARDTINLDIAVSDKEERKHLVKAYVGLRSRGLDVYAHYRVGDDGSRDAGLIWVQKRSIDLRNFRLEYHGYKGEKDQGEVLRLLVLDGHQELATYFVTRCDVRDADIHGTSTLILASWSGYLEIVQALLGREGTDVNKGGSYGSTALHYAARKGHIEVARALLQAGANARKSNKDSQTPLHWASNKGCIEIVRALLEAGAGADVRKCDKYSDSPISFACKGKHLEVFRALVEAGGDVNKLDSRLWTALHWASCCGLTEGVRYLCVERGADVNKSTTGGDGHTQLTLASVIGKVEAARVLLEAGADVNKRTSHGRTPLYLALKMYDWQSEQDEQAKLEVAALLRETGAQEPTANELAQIEQQNAES